MGSIRIRSALLAALAFSLVVTLGACGAGSPGPGSDPQGSVQAAFAAAQSGGIGKLTDFACAAHKNDITGAFGGGNLSALTAAGVKPEDLFSAMSVTFANLSTKEVSKTDKAATVHVTADMTVKVDKDKFKTIAKTMFAAQGLPADDTTINAMVDAMGTQLSSSQKLDSDVQLVNEGGKWLLCQ